MASTTSNPTNNPATTATCCLRNLRQNSLHGVRTAATSATAGISASAGWSSARSFMASAIADGRIDDRVEHVDDQIDQHEFEREQQDESLNNRIVAHVDRVDEKPAHSRPIEDDFDDDRAAEQETELQPHHGDHRDQ